MHTSTPNHHMFCCVVFTFYVFASLDAGYSYSVCLSACNVRFKLTIDDLTGPQQTDYEYKASIHRRIFVNHTASFCYHV